MSHCLYDCKVMHQRMQPQRYGFTSGMFMFKLDLDRIPELVEELPILSHNRSNIYSFHDKDHLWLGRPTLRENVEAYLVEQGINERPARIELLTSLRVMGYVFNPVSFYFCSRSNGLPLCIIAEVHNTFGELKPFLLRPEDFNGKRFEAERVKHFYISPFSELDPLLQLRLEFPGEHLALYVNSRHRSETAPFFRSSLTGRKRPLTQIELLRFSFRFPFITVKVMALIHWHALRLYLRKAPPHSKSEHPELQRDIYPKWNQTPNNRPPN